MANESDPEPSVFTKIINGEFPGRFVWRADDVVAFLSIGPIAPGHTLVVPTTQVDRWTDLEPTTWAAVSAVSHEVGIAIQDAFAPARVGQMIAGFEVPHCHVHLIPTHSMRDLDFARAQSNPDPAMLDDAADRIRAALAARGHSNVD